jgi:hypothetical protein
MIEMDKEIALELEKLHYIPSKMKEGHYYITYTTKEGKAGSIVIGVCLTIQGKPMFFSGIDEPESTIQDMKNKGCIEINCTNLLVEVE